MFCIEYNVINFKSKKKRDNGRRLHVNKSVFLLCNSISRFQMCHLPLSFCSVWRNILICVTVLSWPYPILYIMYAWWVTHFSSHHQTESDSESDTQEDRDWKEKKQKEKLHSFRFWLKFPLFLSPLKIFRYLMHDRPNLRIFIMIFTN